MKNSIILIGLSVVITILTGCSNSEYKTREERYEDSVIPKSSQTMKEIYDNRGVSSNQSQGSGMPTQYAGYMVNKRPTTDAEVSVSPYTVNNAGKTSFRKLPNPTIYMYIFPTLTKEDRLPRPGWITEFSMYERDEYALPGEVSLVEGY